MGLFNFFNKKSQQNKAEIGQKIADRLFSDSSQSEVVEKTVFDERREQINAELKRLEEEGVNVALYDNRINPYTHIFSKEEMERYLENFKGHVNRGGYNKNNFKAEVLYADTVFRQAFDENNYSGKIYDKLSKYLLARNLESAYIKFSDNNFLYFTKNNNLADGFDFNVYLVDGNSTIKEKFYYEKDGATFRENDKFEDFFNKAIEKLGLSNNKNGLIYEVDFEKYSSKTISSSEKYKIKNDILIALYLTGQYNHSINFLRELITYDNDINPYIHPCLEFRQREKIKELLIDTDDPEERYPGMFLYYIEDKDLFTSIFGIAENEIEKLNILGANFINDLNAFLSEKNFSDPSFSKDDAYLFIDIFAKRYGLKYAYSDKLTEFVNDFVYYTNGSIKYTNFSKNISAFNKNFGKEFKKTFTMFEFYCFAGYLYTEDGITEKNISKFKAELKINYYASRNLKNNIFEFKDRFFKVTSYCNDKGYDSYYGSFKLEEIDKETKETIDVIYDKHSVKEPLSNEYEKKFDNFLNFFSKKYSHEQFYEQTIKKIQELYSKIYDNAFSVQKPSYALLNLNNDSENCKLQIAVEPCDDAQDGDDLFFSGGNTTSFETKFILQTNSGNILLGTSPLDNLEEICKDLVRFEIESIKTSNNPFFDLNSEVKVQETQNQTTSNKDFKYESEKKIDDLIKMSLEHNKKMTWEILPDTSVIVEPNDDKTDVKISILKDNILYTVDDGKIVSTDTPEKTISKEEFYKIVSSKDRKNINNSLDL